MVCRVGTKLVNFKLWKEIGPKIDECDKCADSVSANLVLERLYCILVTISTLQDFSSICLLY